MSTTQTVSIKTLDRQLSELLEQRSELKEAIQHCRRTLAAGAVHALPGELQTAAQERMERAVRPYLRSLAWQLEDLQPQIYELGKTQNDLYIQHLYGAKLSNGS